MGKVRENLLKEAKPSRRGFLKMGASAFVATRVFSINVLGANEKVVVGLMGTRNRGMELAALFSQIPDADLAFVADPDTNLFRHASRRVEGIRGATPQCEQDFRRLLDNRDIDAMLIATPDHWHALGAVLCCQAGKDVYVEKPVCHSIWEGRQMVAAADKYGRVVSAGLQNRSMPDVIAARDYIRSGNLGDIHYARIMNNKARSPLSPGNDADVPQGVDYDIWLGPAPERPFNSHHFHYNWHWFWQYSGGDIMNDAVHQMDIVRFLLDLGMPKRVYSTGGKYCFDDAQETPDTQTVVYDYDNLTVNLEQSLWTRYMKKDPHQFGPLADTPWLHNGTRLEIYGTRQHLLLARHGGGWEAFDADGKPVHKETAERSDQLHMVDFIECVRNRALPATSILEGFKSTQTCIQGNISYRLGRALDVNPENGDFINAPDAEADILSKRTYRSPWVIPKLV